MHQASCLDLQKSHSGPQCDVWICVTGNEMRGVSYSVYVWESVGKTVKKEVLRKVRMGVV